MKKTCLFLLGLCLIGFCACATPDEPNAPDDPTNPDAPSDPSDPSKPDGPLPPVAEKFVVTIQDDIVGGTVSVYANGEAVTPETRLDPKTMVTVVMIPDDDHILTGSNIAKGCAARDSFKLTKDTVIRPVFETIVADIPSKTHTICNYNIRYYNGSSDENNTGNRSWLVRKEKVFQMITQHDMDVCGIEEITKKQSPDFITTLLEYEYVGYGRDNGKENSANGGGEQTGVLYKKAKYVKLDQGRFFLSNTPEKVSKLKDSSYNRMVMWVKLKVRGSEEVFYFFATHFDHNYEQKNIDVRAAQADIAINMVPKIAGEYPYFFVGDFNCEITEPAYDKLSTFWTDAFIAMGEDAQGGYLCNDEQQTAYPTQCEWPGNTYTGLYSSSDKSPKRIDLVLFDDARATVSSYMADNDNLGLELYPSDHLPVITEMEFK